MEQTNSLNSSHIRLVLLLFATMVGFGLTYLFLTADRVSTSTSTDELSGEVVNDTLVNNAANINPHMPYFIGFESLTKNGISNDDMDYIRDMIEVYTLNEKGSKSAKVSFVNDSFKYTNLSDAASNNYEFKFGINGGDIHTALVQSNFIDNTISIELKDAGSRSVAKKSFDIKPIE